MVGGGYCRLPMPLKPALAVGGTVAGHRLGAPEGRGGGLPPPPSNASLVATQHKIPTGTTTPKMEKIHIHVQAHLSFGFAFSV